MQVDFIDKMGNDDAVVDAARVSFENIASKYTKEQNDKLLLYLAKHNHISPFFHAMAKFRIHAPIFVARQMVKHQVGFAWNEVSRRYVDKTPEFYMPRRWRERALNKKQGSGEGFVDYIKMHEFYVYDTNLLYKEHIKNSLELYENMIKSGVAPEQARMVLPQSMYTTWIWTGSLHGWARVCNLRLSSDAQEETRAVAKMISDHMERLFPVSWRILVNYG